MAVKFPYKKVPIISEESLHIVFQGEGRRVFGTKTVGGTEVAVKVFDESCKQDFDREVQTLHQLHVSGDHPGVQQLIEHGEFDVSGSVKHGITKNYFHISKKLCVLRDPRCVKEALENFHQLLDALAHLHSHCISHGDVSPDNLMRDGSQIVVIDFDHAVQHDHQLTSEARLGMKPRYLPLEAVKRKQQRPRDDLYAAAVVCIEWITGVKPFQRFEDSDIGLEAVQEAMEAGEQPFDYKVLRRVVRADLANRQLADDIANSLQLWTDPASDVLLSARTMRTKCLKWLIHTGEATTEPPARDPERQPLLPSQQPDVEELDASRRKTIWQYVVGCFVCAATLLVLAGYAVGLKQYFENNHSTDVFEPVDTTNIHYIEANRHDLFDRLRPTLIGLGSRWFLQFTATNPFGSVWNETKAPYKCIEAVSHYIQTTVASRNISTEVLSAFTMSGYDAERFHAKSTNGTTILVLTNATAADVKQLFVASYMQTNAHCTELATLQPYVTAKWLKVGPEAAPFRVHFLSRHRLMEFIPAVGTLLALVFVLRRKRFLICTLTSCAVAGLVTLIHCVRPWHQETPVEWQAGAWVIWIALLSTLFPLIMIDAFRCHVSASFGDPLPGFLRSRILILVYIAVFTWAPVVVITVCCNSNLLRHQAWIAGAGSFVALLVGCGWAFLLPWLHKNDRVFNRPQPQLSASRVQVVSASSRCKHFVGGVWMLRKVIRPTDDGNKRRGVTAAAYTVIVAVSLVVYGIWFGWVRDTCPQTVGQYDLYDDSLLHNHERIDREFGQHWAPYFLSVCAFPSATVLDDDFVTALVNIVSGIEWINSDVSLHRRHEIESYVRFNTSYFAHKASIMHQYRTNAKYQYLFNSTVSTDRRCTTIQIYTRQDPYKGGKEGTALLHYLRGVTHRNPFPNVVHSMAYGGVQSRMATIHDQWNDARKWIHYGSFPLLMCFVVVHYAVAVMSKKERTWVGLKKKLTSIMHSWFAVGAFLCPPYLALLVVYAIFDRRDGQFFFLEATFVVPLTVQSAFLGFVSWIALLKAVANAEKIRPDHPTMLNEIAHVMGYTFMTTLRCVATTSAAVLALACVCHFNTFVWASVFLVALNGAFILVFHSFLLPVLLRTPVYHKLNKDRDKHRLADAEAVAPADDLSLREAPSTTINVGS